MTNRQKLDDLLDKLLMTQAFISDRTAHGKHVVDEKFERDRIRAEIVALFEGASHDRDES